MAVYVDDANIAFGRMISCHLIADTDEELHAMAEKIGLSRSWHQAPPRHSLSHYDVSLGKRALAVKAGAKEITWEEAGEMAAARRHQGSTR